MQGDPSSDPQTSERRRSTLAFHDTGLERTVIFWIWEGYGNTPHPIPVLSGPPRVNKRASSVPVAPHGGPRGTDKHEL